MRFLTIVLIVFFSLALTNGYSVFSERYVSTGTFTGITHTQSGDYMGHITVINGDGNWQSTKTSCKNSTNDCYTRTNGYGWVQFDFNALTGLPLDTNANDCYETYVDSNDSLVTVFVGPCAP